MKKAKYYILIFLFSSILLLPSCEKIINPDLYVVDTVIVVDSWLSSKLGESYIKLSKTAPYNSQQTNPPLTGIVVRVNDNQGNSYQLLEETTGKYYFPSDFQTLAGNTYTLSTVINSQKKLFAQSTALKTPIIDSLKYSYFEGDGIIYPRRGFYINAHFRDLNTNQKNFYFWRIFKNNSLKNNNLLLISDDGVLINDKRIFRFPYDFQVEDTVRVELYAISEKAFRYYSALRILSQGGSPVNAVPSNPETNITGATVMGYFNVSTHSQKEIIIK